MSLPSKAISPGELSPGMFVTVLANLPYERQEMSLLSGDVQTIVSNDRSGMGNVHTVLAVELPYVVLRREGGYSFTDSYDTRRTILMELTPEYVRAMHPKLVKGLQVENKLNDET